jgi:uncharacterized protein (TIGR02996 family)
MAGKTVRVAVPDRPEVKALLADIRATPDDLGLRLILADWLEEHDDPRGTFLRCDCYAGDPASAPPGIPSQLWEKEAEALRQHHESLWVGQLREHLSGWVFHRGLLRVKLKAARLPRAAESDGDTLLAGLRRSLRQMLQLMTGSADGLTHEALQQLADTETWAWVETVTLQNVEVNELPALLASPLLRTVHSVDLTSTGLGDAGASLLAASLSVGHLRELRLSFNSIGSEGFEALAHSPHLAGLQELTLDYNHGEDEGAIALARSPYLHSLQRLHLNDNQIGSPGAEALAASPILAGVKVLSLSHNPIGRDGARALAASPHLCALKLLTIMDNYLGEEGRAVLRDRFGDRAIGVTETEGDFPDDGEATV